NSSQRRPDSQASSAIHVSPATDVSSRLLLGQGRWSSFRAGEGRRLTDHSRERLQMKRFLMLTALAVGLGVGAAHAQKVADLGMAGRDPASGKAPKQAVIFFHGYTQQGQAMKPLADTMAKRLPDA